jgi:hypothetical protein
VTEEDAFRTAWERGSQASLEDLIAIVDAATERVDHPGAP